ncbi:MAG: hypothetical protein IPG66_17600 [Hydrogenophilales bacterium]|nr:hypothetical protein [Hydrogenophilales bacterium]
MLKPIHHVACSPALRACRGLQERLLAWLCEPATTPVALTQANVPGPSAIEAQWLWALLEKTDDKRPLLERARVLAAMTHAEKTALLAWGQSVAALAAQFQPNPPPWPARPPAIPPVAWRALKELMEAFYEKGLKTGLPYAPDGAPVAAGGVSYADFVRAFREAHRLNPDPKAREVCVLCGGPLGSMPEVDHWIAKHAFPLLSVCAYNLLPICGDCNSTSNKGSKDVFGPDGFQAWFHPYLRPGTGAMALGYAPLDMTVTLAATHPADEARVGNLNRLLNLTDRWTREFKMEYAKQQGILKGRERKRLHQGEPRHTQAEVTAFAQDYLDDLFASEPFHEVHQVLANALLEQARLDAWQTELVQVT